MNGEHAHGTVTTREAAPERPDARLSGEARTVFGGNGVTLDYPPMRHKSNLESVRTYEGTEKVHTLILGNAITGIRAFR
jgi:glutaryl-CoA dehydrogenase